MDMTTLVLPVTDALIYNDSLDNTANHAHCNEPITPSVPCLDDCAIFSNKTSDRHCEIQELGHHNEHQVNFEECMKHK